jgi:hypothetical protein
VIATGRSRDIAEEEGEEGEEGEGEGGVFKVATGLIREMDCRIADRFPRM